MLSRISLASPSRRHDGLPRPAPDMAGPAALIDLVDAASDSRIALIGPGTLDMGCALMASGCMEVAFLRLGECPRDMHADIVLVPEPPGLDAAGRAVATASRVLAPLGTLALGGLSMAWLAPVRAQLRTLGFDNVRSWAMGGSILLRADLPLHGPLHGPLRGPTLSQGRH